MRFWRSRNDYIFYPFLDTLFTAQTYYTNVILSYAISIEIWNLLRLTLHTLIPNLRVGFCKYVGIRFYTFLVHNPYYIILQSIIKKNGTYSLLKETIEITKAHSFDYQTVKSYTTFIILHKTILFFTVASKTCFKEKFALTSDDIPYGGGSIFVFNIYQSATMIHPFKTEYTQRTTVRLVNIFSYFAFNWMAKDDLKLT